MEDPEPEHHETDGQHDAPSLHTITTVYVPHYHSYTNENTIEHHETDALVDPGGALPAHAPYGPKFS